MFCRNCGQEMNADQAICTSCGVPVGKGKKFCPNCGKETVEDAVICVSCGVSLEGKKGAGNGEYLNGKDKVMMALICFFLGGLGVHNFMLGETKKGIVRLVLTICGCGIGGILGFVDFIMILCDKYVVNPNKLFF